MANKFLHPDTLMPDVRHDFTPVGICTGTKTVYCGG